MATFGVYAPDHLRRAWPNLYPALCDIHNRQPGDGYSQAADMPAASPVVGLTGLPCRVAPIAGSRETRAPDQAWMENKFHISLAGYQPSIRGDQFARVDGVFYQIEPPPQHDGNRQMTRLLCRVVE